MSSYNWAQRPTQENKDTNGLAVTMCLFHGKSEIHLSTTKGFLHRCGDTSYLGKRYLTAYSNHQSGVLRDGHELTTVPCCQTRPLESCHFFLSPPRDAKKCNHSWGCWIDWWTHQSHAIYPTCANQHQKIAVLTAPIPGPSGSRVVSCPDYSQTTEAD